MKVEASEKVVDNHRLLAVVVNAVEDIACRSHRQRGYSGALAAPGDSCDTGSDTNADRLELAQFIHHGEDLSGICSVGINDSLDIIKYYEDLPGGKDGSQRCEILEVFDPCADNLGEACEQMNARGWKLIATDKSTVIAKMLLDALVVEDREGN